MSSLRQFIVLSTLILAGVVVPFVAVGQQAATDNTAGAPTATIPVPQAPGTGVPAPGAGATIPGVGTPIPVGQPPAGQIPRGASGGGMTPLELSTVKVGGEIGRRLDLTVKKNLLALDVDNAFLEPFRQRNQESGYIGLGKLIDATVQLAAYTQDEKVLALKEHLVGEAIKTQEPDGYIGILVPQNRVWGVYDIHEMSYLVLGLTHDYQFFGEETSLEAARKLADFIINRWSAEPTRIPGPTGQRANMYGVTTGLDEALLTLFQQTKDQRYLDFCTNSAQYKLGEWNSTIKMDVPNQPLPMDDERHCYIFMALCVAQLQLNEIARDAKLVNQTKQALDFLTRQDGLLISGSCSLNEAWHDSQVGSGNVSESCATAYLTRLMERSLRLTGKPGFGNMVERSIFNALFAAQSPDGRSLRYFTCLEGNRTYFDRDTFCCPGNWRRIMAELPTMIYYKSNAGGLAIDLYTESTATIDLGGDRSLTVTQETDYPTSGNVKITLAPTKTMGSALRLRIPGWCPVAYLTVRDESPIELHPGARFVEVSRAWKEGDTLTLSMDMPWRFIRGHKTQDGRVALMRGPVVYCIGTANNAELLKTCPNPTDLIIDPASLGSPVPDRSIRPDGLKVSAKAWAPGADTKQPASLDVVLTEFIDPTGVATYFRVPDVSVAVEDELYIRK